ncbi:MarR family winged helix-turn-helix transcriptional regulator [Streptosporangium sp. 'caverna']|uniref:MarR family winged helix-turn-helix transcriptional regulator n=1 Tax=Streptosporangium sp. 'caverna' TaxID=2202249 RepID=UPI000D7D9EC0|nr:MarR family transcriptional regulator [Streptosporangium sp. 'caverna']AWS43609.1 MarR family transcriptional regulator [Streptosporangium sp. 'caverna']
MADPEWLTEREQRAWQGFLTMREEVTRRLNRRLLLDSGLSEPDYAILATLSEASEGHLRILELRERLMWEKTRLTHQLSRMIKRGLVERRPPDPRGTYVALTAKGRETILAAAPLHIAYVRRSFIEALSPVQLDALAAISETVLKHQRGNPEE